MVVADLEVRLKSPEESVVEWRMVAFDGPQIEGGKNEPTAGVGVKMVAEVGEEENISRDG